MAVCLVIVKNKSMHTATNYYLFSLAISDLMILVLGKVLCTFFILKLSAYLVCTLGRGRGQIEPCFFLEKLYFIHMI